MDNRWIPNFAPFKGSPTLMRQEARYLEVGTARPIQDQKSKTSIPSTVIITPLGLGLCSFVARMHMYDGTEKSKCKKETKLRTINAEGRGEENCPQ